MMQDEFERLTGKPINAKYYPRVELAYMYGPQAQSMNKAEFAGTFNTHGWEWITSQLNTPECEPYMDQICYSDQDEFSTFDVNMRGYCRNTKAKKVQEVVEWIKSETKAAGIDLQEYDYFSVDREDGYWPIDAHRILCFAVTGGSEGHYIHVEAAKDGKLSRLILAKTFMGFDHALALSNCLSKLLS